MDNVLQYLLVFLLLFIFSTYSFAKEDQELLHGEKIPEKESTVDYFYNKIQSTVRNTANRLDLLFSDEEIPENINNTRLRFRPTLKWSKNNDLEFTFPLQLILILPRANKKLQLVIERLYEPDNKEIHDKKNQYNINKNNLNDDMSTLIGMQYMPISKISHSLRILLGPRIKGPNAYLYGAIKGRISYKLGRHWKLKLKQSIFYDKNEFGEETSIFLEHPIGKKDIFEFSNYAKITERTTKGVDLTHKLTIKHLLWKNAGIKLFTEINAHTHKTKIIDNYNIGIAYHQSVWKDWIILNIEPTAIFPRSKNFNFTQEYQVSLDIIF